MFSTDVGLTILALGILLGCTHMLGYLFEKIHQPRLIGEIMAGFVLGPFALGSVFPEISRTLFCGANVKIDSVLSFFYHLGLMLLMFIAGSQSCHVVSRKNRQITVWLVAVGAVLPFLIVYMVVTKSGFSLRAIIGPANHELAALLVLAIAAAVTSIPVISRIFYDLKIMNTRFAGIVIGSAIFEDIILWGVLSVATTLIDLPISGGGPVLRDFLFHLLSPIFFMLVGLLMLPKLLQWLHRARWNVLVKSSPIGYIVLILLVYTEIAFVLGVNPVFAAFLAGFGVAGGAMGNCEPWFNDSLDTISKFSLAVFIPVYFALVGCKLVFGRDFSLLMLSMFLIGSSLLAFACTSLAAYCAGLRNLSIVNLCVARNARGGPGIVLACVAFDSGIISGAFYTTLVLTAIITSQTAGAWFKYSLKRGWPLL